MNEFLAVYDYGQGAVWLRIVAESKDDIAGQYPSLHILSKRPAWMTATYESRIRTVNLDDQNDPFLAALRNEAERSTRAPSHELGAREDV